MKLVISLLFVAAIGRAESRQFTFISMFFISIFSDSTTQATLCSLPLYVGNCLDSSITRYYYDSETKSCLDFKFGGCSTFDENANNFLTRDSCERLCVDSKCIKLSGDVS
jgi:hypothetical protein